MAREFVSCERGQIMLMPPSLVEWLPEDHLVWTVLGAVEQMDLERFRDAYRLGAAGRAPYDPAMMGWIQLVVATLNVEELRRAHPKLIGELGQDAAQDLTLASLFALQVIKQHLHRAVHDPYLLGNQRHRELAALLRGSLQGAENLVA